MSKQIPIRIMATWFEWNYYRTESGPYWDETASKEIEGRDCAKSIIVHFGQGGIRKILKKSNRTTGMPYSFWVERFGSHERMTRKKVEFKLCNQTA